MSVDPAKLSTATAPGAVDRIMLALLLPALVLPVLAIHYGVLASHIWAGSSTDYGFVSGAVTIFMYILLGSMTLNAWLLLRHPATFAEGALPRRISAMQAWLYALLVVWILTLAFAFLEFIGLLFALPAIGLSIAILVAIVSRESPVGSPRPVTALQLPPRLRIAFTAYLVVSAVAVTGAVVLVFVGPSRPDVQRDFAELSGWSMLLLGLPLSHPLYLVSAVVQVGGLTAVATAIAALPVVANAVFAGLVLFSTSHRVRLTNWFFRLRADTVVDPWRARVESVWASELSEPEIVAAIEALVAERSPDDPLAVYELASARDFAGLESEAEPLYRRALALGLPEPEWGRTVIQLASTLRNLGRVDDARTQLDAIAPDHPLAGVAAAFRALIRADRAEVTALLESSASLPEYGAVVRRYAEDLLRDNPVT